MDQRNKWDHYGKARIPPKAVQVPRQLSNHATKGRQCRSIPKQYLGHFSRFMFHSDVAQGDTQQSWKEQKQYSMYGICLRDDYPQ